MGRGGQVQVRRPRLVEHQGGSTLWWWGYGVGVALPVLIVGCIMFVGHLFPTVLAVGIIGCAIVVGTVVVALLIHSRSALYFAGMSVGGLIGGVFATVVVIVLELEMAGFHWFGSHYLDGVSF
ncbi:MAG TPA: hypothetical protein VGL06_26270 [Pseudonocardiaceae bacterium]